MTNYTNSKADADRSNKEIVRLIQRELELYHSWEGNQKVMFEVAEASFELDTKEVTDFVATSSTGEVYHIACRVRSFTDYRKESRGMCFASTYGDQFTIRCARDTGATSEYEKVLNGYDADGNKLDPDIADYFFHGFKGKDGKIGTYKIGRFDIFTKEVRPSIKSRQVLSVEECSFHYSSNLDQCEYKRCSIFENLPDSNGHRSRAIAFRWKDFPSEMVLASRTKRSMYDN